MRLGKAQKATDPGSLETRGGPPPIAVIRGPGKRRASRIAMASAPCCAHGAILRKSFALDRRLPVKSYIASQKALPGAQRGQERRYMAWTNPLKEQIRVVGTSCELTPFVFRGRLYRLENFMRFHDFTGKDPAYRFHEDGFRIRDVESDRILSVPLLNHYFAIAFPWNDRVYVFAGDYEDTLPWWNIRRTVMISSDDLITWTSPRVVMEAENGEHLFNYAVCRAHGRFFMLYETNDRRWPAFIMRFCESVDLVHWRKLGTDHIYGTDKYTGGPALYHDGEQDWFYCLYLEDLGDRKWETRITRSRDLKSWQDAPAGRPVVTFDETRDVNAEVWPGVKERSASDVELCEFEGKTHVYWINGNQEGAASEYRGTVDGPMNRYLRAFFG